MPKSMTGFARVDHSATWGNAVVELKSVNHRFLDLNFRMPDFLRAIEHPLREQIRKQLARGKVDCSISLKFNANQGNSLQLDHDVANAYIAATAELGNILSSVEQLTPSQLLQLPGVLSEQKVDTDTLQKDISNAVTQALKLLNQSRQREGDVLGNEVTQRTQQIRTLNNSLSPDCARHSPSPNRPPAQTTCRI